jgi:hypothetical protein
MVPSPYALQRPQKDLARTKTIRVTINGRPVTVSTDRIKSAYIIAETDDYSLTTRAPMEHTKQTRTTAELTSHTEHAFRSPRSLPPARFNE